MGPPRERGGEDERRELLARVKRRFNGAAARTRRRAVPILVTCYRSTLLQWGRRANAAESGGSATTTRHDPVCFNGAAARTRRRVE